MRDLDISNLGDLFAIDAPLINRVKAWITDDLQRSVDDLEELHVEAMLKPDKERKTYHLTGELRITALFPTTTTHTLILDQSTL